VISPCLSNIFLHHVLDGWFETRSDHGSGEAAPSHGMLTTL